ncbi:hypothetical protein WG66_004278 [Moniliophthora roreri]|nr:hypothetical protein WG66_004278 [Moniliophthora roreri]
MKLLENGSYWDMYLLEDSGYFHLQAPLDPFALQRSAEMTDRTWRAVGHQDMWETRELGEGLIDATFLNLPFEEHPFGT